MLFFTSMRVGTKLILGFLIVAMLGATVGGVGVYFLSQVNKTADNMYRYETLGVQHAAEAKNQIVSISTELRNVFVASGQAERVSAINNLNGLFAALDESLVLARRSFTTDEGRSYLDNINRTAQEYKKNIDSVLSRINEQPYLVPSPLVNQIVATVVPIAVELDKVTNQAIAQKVRVARDYNREIASSFISVRNGLITMVILGTLLALVLGFLITRGLIRQLGGEPAEVSQIADAISHGKLHNHIDLSRAVAGSVMHSMDLMQSALSQTVTAVRRSSDSIAAGSSQIAAGNMDLSQRTEEQAANVTETASAMEEITSTLRSNADAAHEATQLAAVVRNSAAAGQNAAKDVEVSMEEMRDSSEKISNIINVIDGIAFQTNILALNAAVEAARAGEQGRGFAVVASEVRTLAQRSASAAQDIKNLIEDSVSKVSEGNEKARLAGSTIESMVDQVNQVATLIDEISAATIEQNAGVGQVNLAIGQMEEVTQQNSALVEQSAVASATLNDQAVHLVEIMRAFDLGDAIEVQARERHARTQQPAHQLSAKQHLLSS